MNIEEKRREAFEAWNLAEQQSKWDEITKKYDLDAPMPGGFVEAGSEVNWRIWNAALDSVVIELPEPPAIDGNRDTYTRTQSAYHQGMLAVINAIESSGLKVKL